MSETPPSIEKTIRIAAPPEAVFSFLTDPVKMVRWCGEEAELVAEPGGLFRLRFEGGVVSEGRYMIIDPPRRVVFTVGMAASAVPPGGSRVEIQLTPEGTGTRLTLRHVGFDPSQPVSEGWDHHLDRLTRAAGGEALGPDRFVAELGVRGIETAIRRVVPKADDRGGRQMGRILIATAAGGFTFFVVGAVIYGVLLAGFYAANLGSATGVVREVPVWWAVIVSQLGLAAVVTFVFHRARVATAVGGLKTGAIFGLLFGVAIAFDLYAVTNWSRVTVALVEPLVTGARIALAGGVIGWVLGAGRGASP